MANGLSKALLGGQQGAQLAPSGQTRIDLARALASRSIGGGPVQGGPLDALSRVGQAFFARQMLDEQQQAEQQRQQALADTLRRVTQAGQQGVVTGPGGGGTGDVATPDQRIIDALSSNPQTAPMAAQLTLEQALNPEAQTQTVSGDMANEMFGTNLAPGAAVTIESTPGRGSSIAGVEDPVERPDPLSTDQLEAQVIQQREAGTLSEEDANRILGDLRSNDPSLNARARTAIALDRRVRGEETGTQFDQLSPDQAEQVGERIFSQPERFDFGFDQFGRPFTFDRQEGERTLSTELPPPVDPQLAEDQPQGDSVVGDITVGEGELGVIGQFQRLGNVLTPQFGAQLSSPERAELETDLRGLRERLTSALRDNRRLLSVQVEELRNQVPSPDALLESSPNAIASLLSLRSRLKNQQQNAVNVATNAQIPAQEAEDASGFARELEGIINQLSVPRSIFENADNNQTFQFAQALTPSTAGELSPQSAETMIGNLSDSQLRNLNSRTLNVLLNLVDNGNGG